MNEKNKLIEMDPDEIVNLLHEVNSFLEFLIAEGFDRSVITFAVTKCCISKFGSENQTLINSLHPVISAINAALTENISINKILTVQ